MLPTALLDLTLLRVSTRLAQSPARCISRHMHQAALAVPPTYDYPAADPQAYGGGGRTKRRRKTGGSLAVRSGRDEGSAVPSTTSELAKRVQALEEVAQAEMSTTDEPTFSEEDLLSIYEDLLALPQGENRDAAAAAETSEQGVALSDASVVNAVLQRLSEDEEPGAAPSPFVEHLRARLPSAPEELLEAAPSPNALQVYGRLLQRAEEIIARVERTRALVGPSGAQVQLGIMSMEEHEALTRVCIQAKDGQAAEKSIDLIKRSGYVLPEALITEVLELYANMGQVSKAEHFMGNYLTGAPTDRQRHLHIKAHLRSTPPTTIPLTALNVLHNYELQSLPAPMAAYTHLITALFSVHSATATAQAWDLFAHMRYVAHPQPDALLYTLMIRACAAARSSASQPERALDLWTEMTIDHAIPPSAGAYNAVILACARAGTREYVTEAFRLAKEMLDAHRDAHGVSAFHADGRTFAALLDGAKRIGDLGRARWLLAELVRGLRDEAGNARGGVDEEVMMHVFHAYAAYKPPFKRAETRVVDPDAASTGSPADMSVAADPSPADAPASPPTFSQVAPQTRGEVLAEARALFQQTLADAGHTVPSAPGLPPGRFAAVTLTPRLLNSYLSVYYAHAPLAEARELYSTIFTQLGVSRTPRTRVEALERCANARRGPERVAARAWAEDLWAEWHEAEHTAQPEGAPALPARLVERAHVAMIQLLAKAGELDRAMAHLRAFAAQHPPAAVRPAAPKPAMRGTRTVLAAARPLVRLSGATGVSDDTVPPLLAFADVAVLHHRLVAARRAADIGFVKYICMAYEGALRVRRNATLRAVPETA